MCFTIDHNKSLTISVFVMAVSCCVFRGPMRRTSLVVGYVFAIGPMWGARLYFGATSCIRVFCAFLLRQWRVLWVGERGVHRHREC